MSEWSVYLVRCADASLYCGVAKDVDARVATHNAGKGAKYTRRRGPVQLVWREDGHARGAALSREYGIKQLSREQKLALIAQ